MGTAWIPTNQAARRWLHQDDFVCTPHEQGWQVAARRSKPAWQQVLWLAAPILIGIAIYWGGGRLDPGDNHKWFLNAFLILSVVTGLILVIVLNLVNREHAKIGMILSLENGRLRYPLDGGTHDSNLDEIESVKLFTGTLYVQPSTVHRQSYPLCQLVVVLRGTVGAHLVFTSLTTGRSLHRALARFAQHSGIVFERVAVSANATEEDIPPPRLL